MKRTVLNKKMEIINEQKKSRGPKTDSCCTQYFNSHVGLVATDTSKLHSILSVRTKPVIRYASNTIIIEFSEKYITVNSVKCLLSIF